MNTRKILILTLPILLLGLATGAMAEDSQDADSSSSNWNEQLAPVAADSASSPQEEPPRSAGLREKLRRRLHVMRVLLDIALGLLEQGLAHESSDLGAGA